MGLNCLAIACSPRKKGNTSILAQKALEGCRDAGGKTEFLYLVDYNYVPCRACGGCDTTGKCVIKDDSAELFEKILACDRLILAAPIFSMGICAQAKSFIDRSQQFWAYK
ncbi:MAG: flavodoxin family protein, partial [Thermacetogeniaceae bacterium]